jgi:hypothetical protein
MEFCAEFLKQKLHRLPILAELSKLVVQKVLRNSDSLERIFEQDYGDAYDGDDDNDIYMQRVKKYVKKAVANPGKTSFYDYEDKANFGAVWLGVQEFLNQS